MEVVIALSRLGGVASHAELVDATSRKRLRRAVESGIVLHPSTDLYVLPEADRDHRAAARLHGARCLVSAALAHGWKVKIPPARPQICVPRNRNVDAAARQGVELRWAALTPAECERRLTDPVRTVIDCARFRPFDEALAIADSALRAGDVGPRELADAAEVSPRTGRARALRVAQAATKAAANPMESVLRAICLDIPGLAVEPQVWVGDIGRADLVDRARRLVIEAESMEFHWTRDAYRRDVRRYTAFVRLGYIVLRFCWEDIMLRPAFVRDTIIDVLLPGPPERAVQRRAA